MYLLLGSASKPKVIQQSVAFKVHFILAYEPPRLKTPSHHHHTFKNLALVAGSKIKRQASFLKMGLCVKLD